MKNKKSGFETFIRYLSNTNIMKKYPLANNIGFYIRAISLVALFLSAGSGLVAQSDSAFMYISDTVFNLGVRYQGEGKIALKVTYSNQGRKGLAINRIIAQGITVKNYTKRPLGPGEQGEIQLELDLASGQGYLSRNILIFSNAQNSPQTVRVKGKIIGGTVSAKYKYGIGGLGFRNSQMNFGYIYKGEKATRFMPVMNTSKETIQIRFYDCPDYLTIKPLFDSLPPYESAMFEVTFNTNLCNDWDFVIDKVVFEVLGKTKEKGWVTFTSNIRENFDLIPVEQRQFAPVADIPVKIFNFDTVPNGQIVRYNYLLVNLGKSALHIRALKPTCGCTAALSGKDSVEPGDSTYINVKFDATGYNGMTKQGVSVITDDPKNYKQFLWIAGVVEKK
jgi:hypothetical protein